MLTSSVTLTSAQSGVPIRVSMGWVHISTVQYRLGEVLPSCILPTIEKGLEMVAVYNVQNMRDGIKNPHIVQCLVRIQLGRE